MYNVHMHVSTMYSHVSTMYSQTCTCTRTQLHVQLNVKLMILHSLVIIILEH